MINELEDSVRKLKDQLDIEIEAKTNAMKKFSLIVEERDKMKIRLVKLKARKGKFIDGGVNICKNCSKEYNEADNFNWSCRTHTNVYQGGEVNMWWCCGKKGKDAPGCKF